MLGVKMTRGFRPTTLSVRTIFEGLPSTLSAGVQKANSDTKDELQTADEFARKPGRIERLMSRGPRVPVGINPRAVLQDVSEEVVATVPRNHVQEEAPQNPILKIVTNYTNKAIQ